mmetsp:Transcript_133289/g.323981  ORF Transcript_133289/g.323981 Transcript_133289/m.323981 type:complete len:248 (-) Transcript_133289:68-811(-)
MPPAPVSSPAGFDATDCSGTTELPRPPSSSSCKSDPVSDAERRYQSPVLRPRITFSHRTKISSSSPVVISPLPSLSIRAANWRAASASAPISTRLSMISSAVMMWCASTPLRTCMMYSSHPFMYMLRSSSSNRSRTFADFGSETLPTLLTRLCTKRPRYGTLNTIVSPTLTTALSMRMARALVAGSSSCDLVSEKASPMIAMNMLSRTNTASMTKMKNISGPRNGLLTRSSSKSKSPSNALARVKND